MLDFQNISVHYGFQDVLTNVSFRVNKGERIGVVGPNGSGKSTLMRLILNERSPDHGELIIEGNPRIGSTNQHPKAHFPGETLLEYAIKGVPGFTDIEQEIKDLEAQFDACTDEDLKLRLLSQLGDAQTRFEHIGGYDLETRVKIALGGLGFSVEEFSKPFESFSGGWRMRAELSRVIASEPDLLLLDEPSNYLDLPAVDWLQRRLKLYDGTLMLISHDSYLLRTLTTTIVEVDAGTCVRYEGDLNYYLRERDVRYKHLVAAKENQDRQIEQLQRFVDRFRAQATKASQAQSRQKQIDKINEDRVVLPKRYTQSGRLRLAEPPPCGVEAFRCENLFFSYDGVKNILHDVSFNIGRGDKIALIGYNGLGKTTLMRIIAGTRMPTSGKAILGHNVVPGYLSQEFAETIPPDVSVYRNAKNVLPPGVNEKNFRNQLGAFGFDENDIDKPAGVLSGGEKIRLAFLRLFLAAPNLLLLDEPTTHLDLDGRKLLQDALKKYTGTILLVSHDIDFVREVATSILEITPAGVQQFPGGYDYYCEKTAARQASPASVHSGKNEIKENAPDDNQEKMTSKELRRQRAAEREKIAPQVKALKKKIEQAEKKMEELQAALDEASKELFNPLPTTDFAEVNRKVRTLQFEIDRYSTQWEEASLELEELTS
jgi:ATP-binding cassette subfamily F protein 3